MPTAKQLITASEKVLAYYFVDELMDYADRAEDPNHIFHSLHVLQQFCYGDPRTAKQQRKDELARRRRAGIKTPKPPAQPAAQEGQQ